MPTTEATPTRRLSYGPDPAGKASLIVGTLAVLVDEVRDGLAEMALSPEALSNLGDALGVVAEVAAAVDEAGRWLASGRGRALDDIRNGLAKQAAQIDQARESAWALADRSPVLAVVAGGVS